MSDNDRKMPVPSNTPPVTERTEDPNAPVRRREALDNANAGVPEGHVTMFFPRVVKFTGSGYKPHEFGPGVTYVPREYANDAWLKASGMKTMEEIGLPPSAPLGTPAPDGSMAARVAMAQSGVAAYGETAMQAAAREESNARIGLTTAQTVPARNEAAETPQQRALREEAEAKAQRTDKAEEAARRAQAEAAEAKKELEARDTRIKDLETQLAAAKKSGK